MAKWAICSASNGQLTDICEEEDKFEIYEGPDAELKWVQVPDDCTYEHFMVNGVCVHRDDTEDLREKAIVERMLAYGPIGEQMDMQFRDSRDGTTTWKDHVANVKATTTAPSSIPEFSPNPRHTQLEGRKAWDEWVDNWVPPVV
jgi:hypothetical protein|tara:strand:+ start:1353 stop:1784 length:432 start_codon:yes stop_codon:yes gene_type:complete